MARWTYTAPHRRNKDGTFDSICPVCHLTVGTRENEEELIEDEEQHPCIRSLLKRLSAESGRRKPDRSPD